MENELTQKQLKRKIYLNIFLIVMEIMLVIYITLSWFSHNEKISAQDSDFFVYHVGLPVYLTAQFNDEDIPEEYLNESIDIYKSAIPGDILKFSIFVEIEEQLNASTILVTAHGVPEWLSILENEEFLLYATKTLLTDDDIIIEPHESIPCDAVVKDIKVVPTGETSKVVFTIDVPSDYNDYGNGLCLYFSLYFNETYINQNELLGQRFTMGFTSSLPSE